MLTEPRAFEIHSRRQNLELVAGPPATPGSLKELRTGPSPGADAPSEADRRGRPSNPASLRAEIAAVLDAAPQRVKNSDPCYEADHVQPPAHPNQMSAAKRFGRPNAGSRARRVPSRDPLQPYAEV